MVARHLPYEIQAAGLSDVGLVRQVNEDVWAEIPELSLYVLADGMGGHRAGEVAASQAVTFFCEKMRDFFREAPKNVSLGQMRREIEHVIGLVNSHVYHMGIKNRELKGMGTTLCCLHFHQEGLIHAHVGDSRIYRLRRSALHQLTKDHSLLRELVDIGEINEKQAQEFLYKHIITKAVGTEEFVEPSVHVSDVEKNDVYLICSDGLSDLLPADTIESVLVSTPNVKDAAEKLVAYAKVKGGHDNITVVVIAVEEVSGEEHISG